MPTLGQPGSNAHSSAHTHPGLTFPQVNGLRRGYPSSHSVTPPKPSPTPSQHQSPYQSHHQYTPQQPPQATYPQHLFSNTTPSPVPNVASIPNVQNGNSRHTPSQAHAQAQAHVQAHAASAVGAVTRQRSGPQRQMQQQQQQQQQQQPMAYLQQAMNQPMPPQVPQIQQQMPQPVQQVPQVQPLQQTHQIQQQQVQPVQQQQQQQQPQQVQQPQHIHQPNDSNLMSHTPPHPQAHSQARPQAHSQNHAQAQLQCQTQTHQQNHQNHQNHQQPLPQTHSQAHPAHPQIHQQPPPLPPHPTPQPQNQPAPRPQSEPVIQPQETRHDDEMEIDSQDEGDVDGQLSPKLIDGTPFVPKAPMGEMMSAPPEGGSFPSLDAVHKHVLSYCTSVGYAVVIGRSKKTVPGLKKVLFVCDRAGKPPSRVSPEQRKRKTSSRKCNCEFGFFAIEQRTQWTIRYRPDQNHLKHNHGPSESPLLHPAARKLDSKMVAAVKHLKESGIGVSQTLEILQQQHPHVPLLPRDIYNARAAINRNPQKVEAGLQEARPAIYSKPAPTPEERIRSDLRRELQKTKDELVNVKEESHKEIEELRKKLQEKDKIIEKFEMFIDICNQRVMVQRQKLADTGDGNGEAGGASS